MTQRKALQRGTWNAATGLPAAAFLRVAFAELVRARCAGMHAAGQRQGGHSSKVEES
jgi:hypothetical protein